MASEIPALTQFSSAKMPEGKTVSEYGLNGHIHELELYIQNQSGEYHIAPTGIVSMNIEESLATWVTQGSITVYYNNELAEFLEGFVFRNDGSDFLRVRIYPSDSTVGGKLPSLKLTKKLWELNYLFSIYNVEDVTPDGGGNSLSQTLKKYKKFSFWDSRYQTMISKNIEYSTATSKLQTTTSMLNDDESRSLETDLVIHDIIKTVFDNDPLLSKTGLEQDPENDWDTSAVKLFYTSSAASNAYDDLDYVYSRHVSSQQLNLESGRDYSILSIEKGEGDLGHFSLRSLTKHFEKAGNSEPGEYQLEHFFLQADAKKTRGVGMYRSPISIGNDLTKDIKLRDYNAITKYEFVDISPIINTSQFVTTPVYSFDFKNRTFNAEFKNHSVDTAEKAFTENYISNLYTRNGTGENNFLLKTYNELKQKNYNINPVFSLYGAFDKPELRNPDGLHNLLYTGLFQNTCINFTVPGLTIREPGRFIAIDRPEGSEDNTLDDKLCGQWFVINVMHTFANGAYYNNITAVKVHRFDTINYFDNAKNFMNLSEPFKSVEESTQAQFSNPFNTPFNRQFLR